MPSPRQSRDRPIGDKSAVVSLIVDCLVRLGAEAEGHPFGVPALILPALMIFISPALILAKDTTTMMARSSSLALALCLLATHPAAAQEAVQAFSSAQAVSQTVPFPTMSWKKSLPVTFNSNPYSTTIVPFGRSNEPKIITLIHILDGSTVS